MSDLTGKVAIVTGSNIGLGLQIATRLADHNATTVLACRNVDKASAAKAALHAEIGDAKSIATMALDVSSLESVSAFAEAFITAYDRVDLVVCNAGVMALETRCESVDGFELQLATNHVGHFALIAHLLPLLRNTPGSRVVTQSSAANWNAQIPWHDLHAKVSYSRWPQYCFSKLANIAFVNELNRRLALSGASSPTAFSCHPGYVVGQLQAVSAGTSWLYKLTYMITSVLAGTVETGALPALFAATSPEATVGDFYGPNGIYGGIGRGAHPKVVAENKLARDPQAIKQLWDVSEEMIGFKYDLSA